jgi:hypothetical protein
MALTVEGPAGLAQSTQRRGTFGSIAVGSARSTMAEALTPAHDSAWVVQRQ